LTAATTGGANISYLELFQANLAEIGIPLTIEQLDQTTYVGLIYGDAPVEERPNFMSQSWWPDYNDAWNGLYPTTSCDSWGSKGANSGFYCNEEYEALLDESQDASTLENYEEILGRAQAIITEPDPPAIYYAQPKWTTVLRKGSRLRLQPDQHRHVRLLEAVPDGVARPPGGVGAARVPSPPSRRGGRGVRERSTAVRSAAHRPPAARRRTEGEGPRPLGRPTVEHRTVRYGSGRTTPPGSGSPTRQPHGGRP
jgi:hypothetical protein